METGESSPLSAGSVAGASGACAAPFSSLYLDPDGQVKVCCTTGFAVGRYGNRDGRTLRDIWRSADRARQAAALDAGDFGVGCRECGMIVARGRRENSQAADYDRYWPVARDLDAFPREMDFALSNRCNLQCVMCNGRLSSTIRSRRERLPPLPAIYDDAFFEELRDFLPHLERARFKGGEPFLAWETRRVWDLMIELGCRPETTVTTNGTVWNDQVEHYVRKLEMHPILSVDAMTPATLESIRVGIDHDRFWTNVDRLASVATETDAGMTLSFCLMPQSWPELAAFLAEVERRGCGANVVMVNQPHAHDLLRLPSSELRCVIDGLERQGREMRSAMGSWAPHHDRLVDGLRAHLEHPVALRVGVHAGAGFGPGQPSEADLDPRSIQAELAAWGQREPVEVLITRGTVREVHAPPWSAWLETGSWPGLALAQVEDQLTRLLGNADLRTEHLRDDVLEVDRRWPGEGGPIELRALLISPPDRDADDQRLFLVVRDGDPSPTSPRR